MRDHQLFRIEIYHNGAVATERVRGKERYLVLKAFLNKLEERRGANITPPPIPDPNGDFYVLDDKQLDAYLAFRGELEKIDRQHPSAGKTPRRRSP